MCVLRRNGSLVCLFRLATGPDDVGHVDLVVVVFVIRRIGLLGLFKNGVGDRGSLAWLPELAHINWTIGHVVVIGDIGSALTLAVGFRQESVCAIVCVGDDLTFGIHGPPQVAHVIVFVRHLAAVRIVHEGLAAQAVIIHMLLVILRIRVACEVVQ